MSVPASTSVTPGDTAVRPVISGWSAISGFGLGRREFSAGIQSGRAATLPLDREAWPGPVHEASIVPNFEPRAILGRKGTRSMDRVTALAIVAVDDLLERRDATEITPEDEQIALVLGTSTGSAKSIMSFTRDSLTEAKPYFVDPSRFPNTVMNCAAGHSAIWHRLRGPNVTVAGGRASGLLALRYSRRLLRAGRAKSIVCGGVEEFSSERAWLEWHARDGQAGAVAPGEGCGVVLLEDACACTRKPLAELLAVEVALAGPGEEQAALARCIRRSIAEAQVRADEVWAIVPSGSMRPDADREREAIECVFGPPKPSSLACTELVGDACSATVAFQLATAFAIAEDTPEAAGRAVLLTAIDVDGVVGCALLRLAASHEDDDA